LEAGRLGSWKDEKLGSCEAGKVRSWEVKGQEVEKVGRWEVEKVRR
jgi:hypothetical protein